MSTPKLWKSAADLLFFLRVSASQRQKFFLLLLPTLLFSQTIDLVPVASRTLSRTVDLPGEFQPFLTVTLHAKVAGYIEKMHVDRGSIVKQGDLLAELSAPELRAQIAEAESKVQAAESDRLQAEAQLSGAQSTYERLKKAAETPGAVAGNEVVLAQKQVEAAQAVVRAREQASRAAQSAVQTQKDMQDYLRITAPFEGVVTERMAHPGALVGPGGNSPILVVQQISHLRLVVPVPEADTGGVIRGASVPFKVPAFPDRMFNGTVARIAHTLDPKTRTEPVELDVLNRDGSLAPGMYPTVKWPVRGAHAALLVPKTAVVTTSERTFVIRDNNGHAEWVDVKKGVADGDNWEVLGNLKAGEKIVKRGSDEIRPGSLLK